MTTSSLGESFYDTIVWIRYCKMQFVEGIIHGNKRFDIEKLAGQ